MPYFGITRGPLAPLWRALGYADFNRLPTGIAFAGARHRTNDVEFLTDLSWLDAQGNRHLEQQIFDVLFDMIASAKQLILLDMFLFNGLLLQDEHSGRHLTQELTEALINKKREVPEVEIIFITDPSNTAYGGLPNPYFDRLKEGGIRLVITDLDLLRDSNPLYSMLWRAFVRPFGNAKGGPLKNPFGGGADSISIRTFLHIFNIKANHRKTLIVDKGDDWQALVSTANPHSASFANRNVAIRFSGTAVDDLFTTEMAVLAMCNEDAPRHTVRSRPQKGHTTIQILTEQSIKAAVLEEIHRAGPDDSILMELFYLAERNILEALVAAARRGVPIRIVLDPNKDAFGWQKTGIPNRPVARRLSRAGIAIRWGNTRGEQCHAKMMCVSFANGTSAMILGSANFTRRNLDNFNLETDVRVEGPTHAAPMAAAIASFNQIWNNSGGKQYTLSFEAFPPPSLWRRCVYWYMETTGMSTY